MLRRDMLRLLLFTPYFFAAVDTTARGCIGHRHVATRCVFVTRQMRAECVEYGNGQHDAGKVTIRVAALLRAVVAGRRDDILLFYHAITTAFSLRCHTPDVRSRHDVIR